VTDGAARTAAPHPPDARREAARRAPRFGVEGAAAVVGLVALWALAALLADTPRTLPGPWAVLAELGRLAGTGELWRDMGATLARVLVSFLLALVAGTGAGVLTGLLAMLAIIQGWFWLFCLATFFGGSYAAVVLSFRFAAADGVAPARPGRDLDGLADHLAEVTAAAIARAGLVGRARVGHHWFRWATEFDMPWSHGWAANQLHGPRERNVVCVMPGRDRRRAFVLADHYDTAYMEDVYDGALRGVRAELLPEIAGQAAYRIAPGADLHLPAPGGSLGEAAARLRREPTRADDIARWPGFDDDRARRLLNGLYLQPGLMVSRTHPAATNEGWFNGSAH